MVKTQDENTELWGLNTVDGTVLYEPEFDWIDDFINPTTGMIRVRYPNGRQGAIDSSYE